MKILVYGKGYIGNALAASALFPDAVLSPRDITEKKNIEEDCEEQAPDAIVNCAGKTSLEWCRDNRAQAMYINTIAPFLMQEVCRAQNIAFVHLSSGCIFEGARPRGAGFTEEDAPRPACFYSRTKAWADVFLRAARNPKTLILRIRQPFSAAPHPRNLITKILSYDRLITSQNSMTSVDDFLLALKFLLEKNSRGVFHVCNEGTLSPYDIAAMAQEILGIKKEYVPISKKELDEENALRGKEKRVDAVVSSEKLARAGFSLPHVRERMRRALAEYGTSYDVSPGGPQRNV